MNVKYKLVRNIWTNITVLLIKTLQLKIRKGLYILLQKCLYFLQSMNLFPCWNMDWTLSIPAPEAFIDIFCFFYSQHIRFFDMFLSWILKLILSVITFQTGTTRIHKNFAVLSKQLISLTGELGTWTLSLSSQVQTTNTAMSKT